jgi:hypothetical protein
MSQLSCQTLRQVTLTLALLASTPPSLPVLHSQRVVLGNLGLTLLTSIMTLKHKVRVSPLLTLAPLELPWELFTIGTTALVALV